MLRFLFYLLLIYAVYFIVKYVYNLWIKSDSKNPEVINKSKKEKREAINKENAKEADFEDLK